MKRYFRLPKPADIVCDSAVVIGSLSGAFLLRFDFSIPPIVTPLLKQALVVALLVKLPIFHLAGLHRRPRRYAGLADLVRLVSVNFAASILFALIIFIDVGRTFPRSVYLLDAVLCCCLTSLAHFSVRLYREAIVRKQRAQRRKRILIYGAGSAGVTLVREIFTVGRSGYEVVGFLDDDRNKHHAIIGGVPVFGYGRDAVAIVARLKQRNIPIDEIVIAMPGTSGGRLQEAVANCRATRIPCRTIPGIDELLEGKVLFAQIRDLAFTDLLGRETVQLDESPIRSSIANRCLLVTGAGGSIGSELCRQVGRFDPACVVMLDQAESELFRIDNEMRQKFPKLRFHAVVGDIRDPERIDGVLRSFNVESVFHAAAYKHVPMMEDQPVEAAQNNILGTWNLLTAVRRHQIPNFLMISSDKAVNPSSVMGVTKRVCELMVSERSGTTMSRTKCVSVRFGNVLGSNGSVIPIFQAQIAAGGPVRVTHPQMKRYFMTTSEAVALVLQASTMGEGSEIFVLDMGEPVKIVDLAINLIRLSGLEPYSDIAIQFTGPRPGEKLYEEINTPSELLRPTFHPKIMIFQDPQQQMTAVSTWIGTLKELVTIGGEIEVIEHIRKLVPEYRPSLRWKEHKSPASRAANISRRREVTGFEQLSRVHPQ